MRKNILTLPPWENGSYQAASNRKEQGRERKICGLAIVSVYWDYEGWGASLPDSIKLPQILINGTIL
jgi:hypothetical protein